MKHIIEIQILFPATRSQLIELRDEIRQIEGLEGFELKLPPVPKDETRMGDIVELVIHSLIGGAIHYTVEKGTEHYYPRINALIKKYITNNRLDIIRHAEKMKLEALGVVISDHDGHKTTARYINSQGAEININREYSIEPEHTHAILVGVSQYDDAANFPTIRPVEGNLTDLYLVLNDKRFVGLPMDNIHVLRNETNINIRKKIYDVSRVVDIKTLLIYYSGHGQNTKNKKLSLIAKDTHTIDEKLYNDLEYSYIEDILKSSRASQKIILLDACHSGLAAQGRHVNDYAFEPPVQGTFILASTSAEESSYYKPNSRHTNFTAILLQAFNNGIGNTSEMLSLMDLYIYTESNLEKDFPRPIFRADSKDITAEKFFISSNPGFILNKLLDTPYQLLLKDKDGEAEIEYYKLKERYPEQQGWDNSYLELKKNKLFAQLVHEGDKAFYHGGKVFTKRKFRHAKNYYQRAIELKYDRDLDRKITECNKALSKVTNPRLKKLVSFILITAVSIAITYFAITNIPGLKHEKTGLNTVVDANGNGISDRTEEAQRFSALIAMADSLAFREEIQPAIDTLQKALLIKNIPTIQITTDSLSKVKDLLLNKYLDAYAQSVSDSEKAALIRKIIAIDPSIPRTKMKAFLSNYEKDSAAKKI